MPITVQGTTQDAKLLRGVLADIRRLIDASDKIPAAKRRELQRVLDDPLWSIRANLPFGGRLNGVTYKARKQIRVSLNTFAGGINRFRAVVFHELVHASCEGEFDAEVFECLLFPPSNDLPGGGTWPKGDDLDPFGNGTSARGDGFRESDHFVWDPATGRIWRKNPDGSRGPIVWDGPDVWDKWKTVRRLAAGSAADNNRETFIDYVEQGDYGYVALDEPVIRLPVEEELQMLSALDGDATSGPVRDDFIDFSVVDLDLPVSVRASHIVKVSPDSSAVDNLTRIHLKDGDEFSVKRSYSDVMALLR